MGVAAATPNLVYDAGHQFIEIEGYTPPKIFEPKPKAPPKVKAEKPAKQPKEPKAGKKQKYVDPEPNPATAEVEELVQEETID